MEGPGEVKEVYLVVEKSASVLGVDSRVFGGKFRVEFAVVESTVVELDMEEVVGL